MAMPLGTRLPIWYSALLLVALGLFGATIVWLHWQLMLRQADESMEALGRAAVNVIDAELAEGNTLDEAAREMLNVARQRNYAVAVLDAAGHPLGDVDASIPFHPFPAASDRRARTVDTLAGRAWRVVLRQHESRGHRFSVAIAMPLGEIEEQWHVLVRACALGVPFVMLAAAAGGWWLGRRGLRPLSLMADQARHITAQTLDTRLSVHSAGPELDAVAASFNSVLDRLGSALATQRRFMANASHELRTPVSIARTAADVTLAQPHRVESEYRDALTAVLQQSTRLARLVEDMLVLARADGGGYPVRFDELDLDALIEECAGEFRARARAKSVRLTSHVWPVTMAGDAGLLRQMLANLVGNALDYTPDGGVVSVTLIRRAAETVIEVSDTGIGIPPEHRERVFERFVRLDPARHGGGAGLGLSIARWIAEVHGGRLEVQTSGPEGTVFAATFPDGLRTVH
jgi:heavy metal sensor kinase